jgi:NifU-like protein involved in Fe-S cluster formation
MTSIVLKKASLEDLEEAENSNIFNILPTTSAPLNFHALNHRCNDSVIGSISVENGILIECVFEAKGCSLSKSAINFLIPQIINQPIEDILAITQKDIIESIGLKHPLRIDCIVFAIAEIQNTIRKYDKDK